MKIAILSANLGEFDTPVDPVEQEKPDGIDAIDFHRFTDSDFPPIAGLTPRLQYRIPKLFGYEMFPDYDYYIWLDSSMTFKRSDCVKWFLEQLGDSEIAFFRHPNRGTIKQEVDHIQEKLDQDHWYITPRYKNGLHNEMYEVTKQDDRFKDEHLYASTVFIYRNNEYVHNFMQVWWFYQSRYYTCDQVALPYAIHVSDVQVTKIPDNLFKIGYTSLVSHHK